MNMSLTGAPLNFSCDLIESAITSPSNLKVLTTTYRGSFVGPSAVISSGANMESNLARPFFVPGRIFLS